MALEVYFKPDLRAKALAGLVLTLTAAQANGNTNVEFMRGVVAMARYDVLDLGLSWSEFVEDARQALGAGEAFGILESGE